jgi:hypothetical protein
MKIFCVVTPSHQLLYDRFFLPSLDARTFELHPYTLDQTGTGEFLAEDWKSCIQFKLAKIIESIEKNPDSIIIWSDVDIQFFGLQPDRILSYFQPDADFVAQRWSYRSEEVCGGFYAIRCSSKMQDFFHEVGAHTANETGGNEQPAINWALQRSSIKIKWSFFGREFYARSHGICIPAGALIHHATCLVPGNAVNQKISLLTQLEDFEQWSRFRKRVYVLQQIPAAIRRRFVATSLKYSVTF